MTRIHPAALALLHEHWAMEPTAQARLVQQLLSLPPEADLSAYRDDEDDDGDCADPKAKRPYEMAGSIAVLSLTGLLQKNESWITRWYPGAATSTVAFIGALQAAANAPDVTAIVLRVDSPGGLVNGTMETADAVYAVRQAGKKPVVAVSMGLCCSAAYWIASQASQFFAGETDWIGSIGTRLSLLDSSKFYQELGLAPVEITSGVYKAAGADGQPLTDEVLAYFQGLVDRQQQNFTAGVARGRKLGIEAVRKLATEARVYIGKDAQTPALIDGIDSFAAVVQRLQKTGGAKGASASLDLAAAVQDPAGLDPAAEAVAEPAAVADPGDSEPSRTEPPAAETSLDTPPPADDQETNMATASEDPKQAGGAPAISAEELATLRQQAARAETLAGELEQVRGAVTNLQANEAALRARDARRDLEATLAGVRFGERTAIAPASRAALVEALAGVPGEQRAAVVEAVKGLQTVQLGAIGFQPETETGAVTLTAEEEKACADTAAATGEKVDEVKATFIQIKRKNAEIRKRL